MRDLKITRSHLFKLILYSYILLVNRTMYIYDINITHIVVNTRGNGARKHHYKDLKTKLVFSLLILIGLENKQTKMI